MNHIEVILTLYLKIPFQLIVISVSVLSHEFREKGSGTVLTKDNQDLYGAGLIFFFYRKRKFT